MSDELRALAEAATPGPWVVEEPRELPSSGTMHYSVATAEKMPEHPWSQRFLCWLNGGLGDAYVVKRYPEALRDDPQVRADAAFIAAANPTAVLALLDRLATVTAQLDRAVEALREVKALHHQRWDDEYGEMVCDHCTSIIDGTGLVRFEDCPTVHALSALPDEQEADAVTSRPSPHKAGTE